METKCERCEHRRDILDGGGSIECAPSDVAPQARLAGMWIFASEGRTEVPFVVEAVDLQAVKGVLDRAWPFRFRPEIIGRCTGFRASEA
ncbi:hypothetical protein [Paraburkholderia sediminicola]|uniref:hypothetical protein n=1 Tax=Paraburkholderia sediminicola TaxID=458836 RepID=UPI0038B98594